MPRLERFERGLDGFAERWSARAEELADFLGRWETAWNTHDLDLLTSLVTEDIVWEDPAMFGETVHGRGEFRAFTAILLDAFPDVHFEGIGEPYLALEGAGLTLPWRMTGTFTGELAHWGERYRAKRPTWAPTGRRLDLTGVDLYEFRDGLISNWTISYDLYGFCQQVGLFPSGERDVPRLALRAQRLVAARMRRASGSS
jgi:ketosteroid isomerase-like protein